MKVVAVEKNQDTTWFETIIKSELHLHFIKTEYGYDRLIFKMKKMNES